ncbi:integral membrane protein DUF106-domain-containing protein [Cantharellus anzutake]|uniref:integral membrane protein DUF106-domain-containing protein n=1 Tax=Cantharellus anzutake TaxID=1750568 RepID=UPI001907D317|nr:integral membrane protein DUF106-domain-containing protein [Cantharellus anzutake]KAF8338969.1 integral membrane protein DUF106-domain-containing protein [Cantharellus anzutake]
MILVGILRHYVTLLLNSPPKKQLLLAIREQRAISRSQILRATSTSSPLPPHLYRTISSHLYTAFTEGTYLKDSELSEEEKKEKEENPPNPLTDPGTMDGMVEGLKKQMVMMVPQMLIMGWINFFFQGFVLIKLPFPLTLGFKSMMQRGIETPDMDVRWVSSLSWYFLNFFGLNGLFRLLLGSENAADSTSDMAAQASPFGSVLSGANAPPADNLQFAEGQYKWVCDDVEIRVLEQWGKIPAIR